MNKKVSEKIIAYSTLAAFGIGIVLTGYFVGNIVFRSEKEVIVEVPEETPEKMPDEIVEVPADSPELPENPEIVVEPEDVDDGREITEEKFEEYINYKTVEKDDPTLEDGKTRVMQEGALGQRTFIYEVTLKDGVVVKRDIVSQEVTIEPQDRIILIGTKVMPVITTKTIYEAETIAYDTEYVPDLTQFVGYEKITTQGRNGELIKTIKVTYKDGKEFSRDVVTVETRKEPIAAIVIIGIKELPIEEPLEEPIEDEPTDEVIDTTNPDATAETP